LNISQTLVIWSVCGHLFYNILFSFLLIVILLRWIIYYKLKLLVKNINLVSIFV